MDARAQPAVFRATRPLSVIARETLHRIAARRMPPTPENYERVWKEVEADLPANDQSAPTAPVSHMWSELLAQALRQGVVPQLAHLPELQLDAQALAGEALTLGVNAASAEEINAYSARLRQFWLALEAHAWGQVGNRARACNTAHSL